MPNINAHLKEFRIFRKITQEELALKIGKSKNVISNWENGINRPDVDSIENICKILKVTPNQIFGWEPLPEYECYKKEIMDIKRKRDFLKKELQERQLQLYALEKEYDKKIEELTGQIKEDQDNEQ